MKNMKLVLLALSLLSTPSFAAQSVAVSGPDAIQITKLLELGGAVKESHLDEYNVEVRNLRVSVDSRDGIGPFHAPIYVSSLKLAAEQSGDLYRVLSNYVTSVGTPGNRTISADAISCNAGPDVLATCEIITNYPVIRL